MTIRPSARRFPRRHRPLVGWRHVDETADGSETLTLASVAVPSPAGRRSTGRGTCDHGIDGGWRTGQRPRTTGRPPMAHPGRRSRLGTVVGSFLVSAAVLGCAEVPVPPATAENDRWVYSMTFAVPAPGEGWELEIDRPADRVAYETALSSLDHDDWVFHVEAAAGPRVADDEPLPPEQELADRYLADEDQRTGGGRRSIERGVETVGGKRLHFLRWEDRPWLWLRRSPFPVPFERRTTVYLYFPPELGGRASYLFRVTERREQLSIYAPSFDRTRAFPFIAGFRPRCGARCGSRPPVTRSSDA